MTVNTKAFEGTLLAHTDGDVPNLLGQNSRNGCLHIGLHNVPLKSQRCISGYLNGINPFDQPGVEAYKKNMFRT